MNEFDPQALQIILEESLVEIRSGRETLDSILDKHPDIAEDLRPGLEAALWLDIQRPSLEPRPGFISASRARLVMEISKDNPGAIAARPSSFLAPLTQIFQRKYALQFAFIFILLIGFITTGTIFVAAANSSIPGDPLYGAKLNIEQTRLTFTPTEISRARLNIEYADHRSNELQQLVLQGRNEYIPQTIVRFDLHVNAAISSLDEAADRRPQAAEDLTLELQEVVEEQIVLLTVMAESAPPEAKTGLLDALQVTQAHSVSINELLQKLIGPSPASSPTLYVQASNTPLPTRTSTQGVPASSISSPTPTPTPTVMAASPTPARTDVGLLPQPTPTPTTEQTGPREPTDTPVSPTESIPTPTPTLKPPAPTDIPTATTQPPAPTDIPTPTNTSQPPNPTDIPGPTQPTQPPNPTDIPGFGGDTTPTETPKPTHTPRPTKTPKP